MPDDKPLDLRKHEWVYFLAASTTPALVKIGRSRRLKYRVLGLQTQCPVTLRLVGAVKAQAGAEYVFHEQFAHLREHGEWFRAEPDLLELIQRLPKGGLVLRKHLIDLFPGKEVQIEAQLVRGMTRPGSNGRRKSPYD